jgi:uncharacterized protein (TIGR03086 family)
MSWPPDTVYVEGLGFFSASVEQFRDSDWRRPSPCSEWTALDVLGHVGEAIEFGTRLLRGAHAEWSPKDPPGVVVEGDPQTWWETIVTPALQAVSSVDLTMTVESPVGRRSIGEGLSFPAFDLFVHGWDLARTLGGDVVIPAEVIEFAHIIFGPIPSGQMRSPRIFGGELVAPPDAIPTEAVIAWTGRDPRWTAPTGGSA